MRRAGAALLPLAAALLSKVWPGGTDLNHSSAVLLLTWIATARSLRRSATSAAPEAVLPAAPPGGATLAATRRACRPAGRLPGAALPRKAARCGAAGAAVRRQTLLAMARPLSAWWAPCDGVRYPLCSGTAWEPRSHRRAAQVLRAFGLVLVRTLKGRLAMRWRNKTCALIVRLAGPARSVHSALLLSRPALPLFLSLH